MALKKLEVKGPQGPVHPMQPSTGNIPDIYWNWLEDGRVQLRIFCRCGSTMGKWFQRELELDVALDFLRCMDSEKNLERRLQEIAEFFRWEWTGGTPVSLDTPKPKSMDINLSDLGL